MNITKAIKISKLFIMTMAISMLVACNDGTTPSDDGMSPPVDGTEVPGDGVTAPEPVTTPGDTQSTRGITLNWTAPTTHEDDSVLNDLAGHNIYINDGSGMRKLDSIDNPSVSTYIVENLEPGTYTFTVTAFDSHGVESQFSNEAVIDVI